MPSCSVCGSDAPRSSFSQSQQRKPAGSRKCKACSASGGAAPAPLDVQNDGAGDRVAPIAESTGSNEDYDEPVATTTSTTTITTAVTSPAGETFEAVIDKTKGKFGLVLRETQSVVESDGTLSGDNVVS